MTCHPEWVLQTNFPVRALGYVFEEKTYRKLHRHERRMGSKIVLVLRLCR